MSEELQGSFEGGNEGGMDDFTAGFNDTSDLPSQMEQLQNPHIDGNEDPAGTDTNLTPQQEQMIRLRFNHEDREVPLSEAQELAQKGLNYDRIYERLQQAENDPSRSFIEDLAAANQMSVEDFINAYHESRHQAEIERMSMENSIPPEVAEELILLREDRLERERQKEAYEQEQRQQQEYMEFFNEYKRLTGREFDPQNDTLPESVWQAYEEGTPLRFAYLQQHNAELMDRVKILEQNQQNMQRSPISSTTNYGSNAMDSDDEFIIGFNSV